MPKSREVGSKSSLAAARRALLAKLLRCEGIELPARAQMARHAPSATAPLSFAQERLWFLDQLDSGASVYNISRALRLRGCLDSSALIKGLDAIVQRHEILRTSFRNGADGPVQQALAKLSLDVSIVDLSGLAGAARRAALQRTLAGQANRTFDLAAAPLLRVSLIKLGNTDHVLLLVLHQLVCDGWSMRLFCRELGVFYRCFVDRRTEAPAELPIQYRDYALRQRERFQTKLLRQQLAYWRERLRDSLPGIALPTDHPRPARQTFHGARLPLSLPAARVRALRRLGAQEGATFFMTLMAAFNVLLWRYSDQQDLSVGFPVAHRAAPDCTGLIGLLVNTLVLRTELSGKLTFRELLCRTREHCRGALAHQDLPFGKLVEELARERDLSRNPLFQVMFAHQGDLEAKLDLPGIKSAAVEIEAVTSKFDLTLSLTERSRGVSGFFEYNSDLFDPSTVERMARHFLTLLGGITANPDRPIDELPLLAQSERKQMVVDWNDTAADYPKHRCMHEFFEAKARKNPNAVAVEFAGEHLAYGELNGQADRLARYLRGLGVSAETLVGVCVERSPAMIVAIFAILKAGGAYVPLDPKYPRERIAFMLADAQIEVLLVRERACADGFQASHPHIQIVCLNGDWRSTPSKRTRKLPRVSRSDHLAYVIYTSGSTGDPKGVAIEHRNAVAFLCWAKSVFSRAELAGVLASTSICFDLSIFEIFVPLSWGGTVILVEDALALGDRAPARQITLINAVPSALSELLAAGALPKSLRTVNLAGEPLPTGLVRRIYQCGVDKVYDLYGPSETTTYSTFTLRSVAGRTTIGRPISNTKVYLLDRALQPVPIGVPGELYIGGAGLARGYWRRPELTAERFLHDPYSRDRGARMYCTGDLARYFPDGNIEYLGRADDQVKVRGYRIEPGEIEAALRGHPAIRESVVIARQELIEGAIPDEHLKFANQLIAYVVPAGGSVPSHNELRSFLRRTLPEYMLPALFLPLQALPLTPNGKVDRRALPAPGAEPAQLSGDYVAPRTAIEELIDQEWRAVLNVHRIGIHDNFFDLGGHSLLATRVVGRLRALLRVELPLRKLFELPTIAGLAEQVECLRRSHSGVTIAPIVAMPRDQTIPLSFAQRRLWFLHKLQPGLTAYNIPAVYHIHGPLNVAALEAALRELVKRHESLRTALVELDGAPAQRILAAATIDLPVLDFTDRSPDDAAAVAQRLANEDGQRPYDLGQAPLMRAQLLRLRSREHELILNFHHAIADGSSLAVFYHELAALYDAEVNQRIAKLPDLTAQYADFAVWQQARLHGAAMKADLAYWTRQLGAAMRPLDLPADCARPTTQAYRGAIRRYRLSKQLSASVKELSRQAGVTLFMTLLAMLNVLFMRLSGQDDIVVGSTIAGRARPEFDGVIGFFVNLLALRTDLSRDPPFLELLGRVRAVCLDAYTHQDLPFERIVEALNPQRDPGRNPIFDVLFNMAEVGERDLKLTGCKTVKLTPTLPAAKFDLVIRAAQVDGCVALEFVYNADLFCATRIDAMLDQFAYLSAQISADPAKTIGGYSLLTSTQQTVLPDPSEKLGDLWAGAMPTIIADWTTRRPQAPAIVGDGGIWTYKELDRESNRLANYLISGGIEPGAVVAIYAQRGATLPLAILGALKAGAIFVILDPAYPSARLVDYLRIARPAAWLQMAGAGEVPEDVARWLDAAVLHRSMTLPEEKEKLTATLRSFADSAPAPIIEADSPAYLAFTSGSTGEPKGVLCRHGPMTHFLRWQEEAFGLHSSDRYALLSGLAYNHLHRDVFTALASGATLFVPNSDCLKDPRLLAAWLREGEITILHLTPALGRMLETARGKSLPSVRRIFFGGDLLSRRDARAMRRLAPGAEIVNFYGATETQRAVGYFRLSNDQSAEDVQAPTIPVGRGAPDVQLLALTARGQLAGIGEPGELYVRSPHLAAGYIDDETLTAAKFLVNSFTGEKSDRLYRTGELGRYLPDGNIEWAGRLDRRVSIRGFRVELAEVEGGLSRYPGVRYAAVIVREFSLDDRAERKDTRLVAYLESDLAAPLHIDEVRRFAGARLPHYMVPAYFRQLACLPLNPNGKIDYFSLAAQEPFIEERASPVEAPRGRVEQRLKTIFTQVLGLKSVGRHDNFFHLGGYSLLAAQALTRVRESLGIDLELRSFWEAPTVAALGRRIEALRASADAVQSADREEIEL